MSNSHPPTGDCGLYLYFLTTIQKMDNSNYSTSIEVGQSPDDVFAAIINVRGWWSENITGNTEQLNGEFIYQYKDVHHCKIRITELVPGKSVQWLVLENKFNFTSNPEEWKGNQLVFDISKRDDITRLQFMQIGLVPENECYNVCRDAWGSYIRGSLHNLIVTGKGQPNTREHDLNQELIEKWGLPIK